LSGATFDNMQIVKSGVFEDLHPEGMSLPKFFWLKIDGRAGADDFGIAADNRLVISQRALTLLEHLGIPDSEVEPRR
jgi:hypothetical protein